MSNCKYHPGVELEGHIQVVPFALKDEGKSIRIGLRCPQRDVEFPGMRCRTVAVQTVDDARRCKKCGIRIDGDSYMNHNRCKKCYNKHRRIMEKVRSCRGPLRRGSDGHFC